MEQNQSKTFSQRWADGPLQGGFTLHGTLVESGHLVLTTYPCLLWNDNKIESGTLSKALEDGSLAYGFPALFESQRATHGGKLNFALPSFHTFGPIPAPRILEKVTRPFVDEATQKVVILGKYVEGYYREICSGTHRWFSLPYFAIESTSPHFATLLFSIAHLEETYPGSISPTLRDIVLSGQSFYETSKQKCEEGEKVSLSVAEQWRLENFYHLNQPKFEDTTNSFKSFLDFYDDQQTEIATESLSRKKTTFCLPHLNYSEFLARVVAIENTLSKAHAIRHRPDVIEASLLRVHEFSNSYATAAHFFLQLAKHAAESSVRIDSNDDLVCYFKNRQTGSGLLSVLGSAGVSPALMGLPALLTNQQGETVTIEPMVFKPEIETLSLSKTKAAFPHVRDALVSLTSLMEQDDSLEPANWRTRTGANVPFLKREVLSRFLMIFDALPELLSNTVVFEKGKISIAVDRFTAKLKPKEDKPKKGKEPHPGEKFSQKFGGVSITGFFDTDDKAMPGELPVGVSPWQVVPSSHKRDIEKSMEAATRIHALQFHERSNVHLRVRFEASNQGALSSAIQSVLTVLKSHNSENRIDVAAALKALNSEMVFEPTPFFVVGEKEYSEEEWGNAKKVGSMRVLGDAVSIEEAEYQEHLERFLLRKQVLSKFKGLRIHELWKVNADQKEFGALSKTLSPEEYLAQLDLRLSSQLAALTDSIPTALESHIKDILGESSVELRPYQIRGVAWIYLRTQLGMGCCLADEMGLGKTLQAISMVSVFKKLQPPGTAPVLCVVPKSLLLNWQREFSKWAPELKILTLDEACSEIPSEVDVAVASYSMLRGRLNWLVDREWSAVILDEAHAIKNAKTQTAQTVRKLQSPVRLALTGTPVENRAVELWSLMDWLNPGWLGSARDFVQFTELARTSTAKRLMLEPVCALLEPVLLRRRKSDPAIEMSLPEKVYKNVEYVLSEEQSALYRTILEVVTAPAFADTSAFLRRSKYLKAILHLKQTCNHPAMFLNVKEETDGTKEEFTENKNLAQVISEHVKNSSKFKSSSSPLEDLIGRSSKMHLLYDLLLEMLEEPGGILIFTQFRASAAAIQQLTSLLGLKHLSKGAPILDGTLSTEERMARVDNFQRAAQLSHQSTRDNPETPILVATHRAGGQGLTLTGANRVIHFDRWWNPAVEEQATDRAHRIGQSRTVFVYTLTAMGTFEESLARILAEKRSLSRDLIDSAVGSDDDSLPTHEEGFLNLVDPREIYVKRS